MILSIDADQPLKFEGRIGFPNGYIGKVSLSYEDLHRYCFTSNLISHDENTCPQLTPAEREFKKKQRAESQANNDRARLPIQGSQMYNTRNPLKRPRSPVHGRNTSPVVASTPSSHPIRDAQNPDYQNRDLRSSSRQDTGAQQGREVWSRLEAPRRREASRGRKTIVISHKTRLDTMHQDQDPPPLANGASEPAKKTQKTEPLKTEHANPKYREALLTLRGRSLITEHPLNQEKSSQADAVALKLPSLRWKRRESDVSKASSPTSLGKSARLSSSLVHRNTTLTITEKHASSPQRVSLAEQRYHLSTLEPNDLSLVPMEGLEKGIDTPLTELESAEVDNLVLETERLEMEENMLDIDNMIDIDNHDLLGDIPDHDAEKIEAISQLSPATAATSTDAPPPSQKDTDMVDATLQQAPATKTQPKQRDQTNPYVPTGLLKKKAPRSPAKGSAASKKAQGRPLRPWSLATLQQNVSYIA
ncbi:hypothetical protein HID58_055658 [Brassica napus]|uniref:Zinc knuckle CX2CX4HX4C domain-containing protein n=1 Tax=Brassica napus TaxID=3708 RepID=A0ABQ8AKZ7_BRANA|nr:hypothetical protein HID58_055658 [Brassica napus]